MPDDEGYGIAWHPVLTKMKVATRGALKMRLGCAFCLFALTTACAPGTQGDLESTTTSLAETIETSTTSSSTSSTLVTTTTILATGLVECGQAQPSDLGFDPFYVHYCSAAGIPVLGSTSVSPAAVEATAEIAVAMIGHRPGVVETMRRHGMRVGVIAQSEVTSDMPEYSDIYELFPGVDWDTRARGLGATLFIPLSSVGEENVLCLPGDPYQGESIMVHEFAHSILTMGLVFEDPSFAGRVRMIYQQATDEGLWANTYAASSADELWAEGVQSYFNTNLAGPTGGNGVHNHIDTREELADYHPGLYDLIEEVFGNVGALPLCQ